MSEEDRDITDGRDRVLMELWKPAHDAGRCGMYCYICAKKELLKIVEEAKREGRYGTV